MPSAAQSDPAPAKVFGVESLNKSYGGLKAVDDVSFEVFEGEILARVGDNGAGKSTLVKAIAGAQPPDSGRIVVDGIARQMGKSEEIATMGSGGTGDEIITMKEGWLTASVLRPIDDSGVAVADAFVAHSKGEEVPLVWGGSLVMVDRWTDADEIVEYANRYSKPKMGR